MCLQVGSRRRKVLILDPHCRGNSPGSSLRAAGILVPGLPEPAHRLVNALGMEDCQKLFQLTKRSIQRLKELQCFKSSGVVMAPLSTEEAEALSVDLSIYPTLGWNTEPHSLKTRLGDKGIGPGLYLTEAGTILPGVAFQKLENAAKDAGAQIHYQCPIMSIADCDNGVLVETALSTIQAELVLHCAGWELTQISLGPSKSSFRPTSTPLSIGTPCVHGTTNHSSIRTQLGPHCQPRNTLEWRLSLGDTTSGGRRNGPRQSIGRGRVTNHCSQPGTI